MLVHALPIYHVHGLFVALHCALLSGATTRFLPRFEIGSGAATRSSVRRAFMGVPTYYTRLLGAHGLSASRHVVAAMDIRLRAAAAGDVCRVRATHRFRDPGTLRNDRGRHDHVESAAWSAPSPEPLARRCPVCSARVRRDDGTLAARGEPGVLEISGPNVFGGYWRNEEKTRASFTDDGYFITGDVVTMSHAGIVSIVGRQNDLIISGGLNVYPKEIEEQIDALAGVTESAVIGVPHPDFGEGVVAVVDRRRRRSPRPTLFAVCCVNDLPHSRSQSA